LSKSREGAVSSLLPSSEDVLHPHNLALNRHITDLALGYTTQAFWSSLFHSSTLARGAAAFHASSSEPSPSKALFLGVAENAMPRCVLNTCYYVLSSKPPEAAPKGTVGTETRPRLVVFALSFFIQLPCCELLIAARDVSTFFCRLRSVLHRLGL
jgi:hypothetical protein